MGPGFVYRECERLELLLPDMEGVDFADTGIVTVLADDQHRFRLVAHLRADMSAHIVVPFVQVKHAMDVQVILRRPLHHLVDDFHGFAGAVDVEHQVTDSVNNHQTVTLATAQCVIDHLYADGRGILAQADEVEPFVVGGVGKPRQLKDALKHIMSFSTWPYLSMR